MRLPLFVVSSLALAITLDEAVRRAAEVDPAALDADLQWRQTRLEAGLAWADLGVTPEFHLQRTLIGNTTSGGEDFRVSLDLLDPNGWFDALAESGYAKSMRSTADAVTLDVQYSTAALYFEALAAQQMLEAAQATVTEAEATLKVSKARTEAGIDADFLARTAEVYTLNARSDLARAEADVKNSRDRLARALEQDVDKVEPAALPALPEATSHSPWIAAAEDRVKAARLRHAEAWMLVVPSAELAAQTDLGSPDWALSLGATWNLDVLTAGLAARHAALEVQRNEVQRDGLQRDFDLLIRTGNEDARTLMGVAEVARQREKLADEALRIGVARLENGLVDVLYLVRLQDDAAEARRDRVQAELDAAYAVLEARRVAGLGW